MSLHLRFGLHYSSYGAGLFDIKTMFFTVKMIFYLRTESMYTRMMKCQLVRLCFVSILTARCYERSTCIRSAFLVVNNRDTNDFDEYLYCQVWYGCISIDYIPV